MQCALVSDGQASHAWSQIRKDREGNQASGAKTRRRRLLSPVNENGLKIDSMLQIVSYAWYGISDLRLCVVVETLCFVVECFGETPSAAASTGEFHLRCETCKKT